MLKSIIKRDGTTESFYPEKLNRWSQWASKHLKDRVDWSDVVMDAVRSCGETISSQELQKKLIDACVQKKDWAHNLMAGRLYAALSHKELYGDSMPKVQELQKKLVDKCLMKKLSYSQDELDQIEKIIDHSKDFELAYFQISQIRKKYSIQDRSTNEQFESPQYTFMRMAMALAEDENSQNKIKDVENYYKNFSQSVINAPSPNYINLGTEHNGYASCCLYTVGDTAKSLAIGDHIAYTMTYMSAGIGSHLNVRSAGDKVRGGAILHQGKLPYFKSLASAVCANIQAGRGGACTSYFNSFDPEVETISMLQNPRSTEDKKNRDIHFASQFNKLFAKKVAKNEDIFLFNAYNAPDLNEAFFSGDIALFEQIYNKYEKDEGFLKKYVSARKLLNKIGTQSFEVGTLYYAFMDEINKHTPFKDPIHSSNLCVAPETMLLTKDGEVEIKALAGQEVEVWNGEQWSLSKVAKTGENQKLLRVSLGMRIIIDATPYHKWYVLDDETDQVVVKTTTELRYNDIIAPYKLPDQNGNPLTAAHLRVCTVKDLGRVSDTYCVNEPVKNSAVFNGVLTHNCLEITEPTAPYENMKDLYTEDDPGYIKIINDHPDAKVKELQLKYTQKVKLSNGLFIQAGDLQVGDAAVDPYAGDIFVSSVVDKKVSPEVALCSLGAINVAIEMTDEQYENAAYYALKMVDKCIHLAHYELPHVGYTAKNRLNAAIGIIGLATHLARKNIKYSSKEGKEEIDKVFERHAYFVIKASLKLGKELGNAPWMHKTKWPEGWLPIDTYNRKVDEIVNRPHTYDWETLRAEIIANGGIRNSALIAHMPTESSSKASGAPNGMYPIRSLFLKKKDVSNAIDWCAIDSDIIGDQYELAWNVPYLDMIECYAVGQKWTDQAISADEYADRSVNIEISTDRIIKSFLHMAKYGVKTRYYVNSLTADQSRDVNETEAGCSSGACTL